MTAFLQSRLPFENKLLRYLSLLSPKKRANASLKAIEYALALYHEFQLQILQLCRMNDDCKHDDDIKKPDKDTRVDITGVASFKSRQQMEIRYDLNCTCEGNPCTATWKFECGKRDLGKRQNVNVWKNKLHVWRDNWWFTYHRCSDQQLHRQKK